jgi:pyridoxal biosynthesis lyase PdxS
MEVEEGLLLNRVDLAGHHLVVDQREELAFAVVAHAAGAAPAIGDAAIVRAQGAEHLFVREGLVKAGFVHRSHACNSSEALPQTDES